MAAPMVQEWKLALQVEKELKQQLKQPMPLFDDIEHLIEQMRIACEATVFRDFEYATAQGVEGHLWDAHSLINKRYRKMVQHYKTGDQKKHVVEKRKLEKRYADFIKRSQFFYKSYIQRLASHFDGMKGLRRIAHRLSLSQLSVDERVPVSPKVERLIELSCHATLLRLGDLSRYRNDLRTKDRSWEPAMAYYGLASDLYPESGSAHNQMAVIALADSNHLDALYHLYRAIAVEEPHPLASGNLEIEFKKITSAWEKGPYVKHDSVDTLVLWFVRLHAKFYKGVDFSTREELENEVLHRLAVQLKEHSMEMILERFVVINVAAEYFAKQRAQVHQSEDVLQSYVFFLGFNVRFLFLLLQILQPELEDPADGEDLPNDANGFPVKAPRDKITPVTRHVLPAVRQYSTWLCSRSHIIIGINEASVKVHINELHKMFADVLTRLANFFPAEDLPQVGYLLEEDASTVGFKPFRDPSLKPECNLYIDGEDLKPRFTDPGIERHNANIEMLARVRDIMLCGLTLAINQEYPITYSQEARAFVFIEEGLPPTSPINSPINGQDSNTSITSPAQMQTSPVNTGGSYRPTVVPKVPNDEIESIAESNMSMESHRHWVNDLVDPTERTHSSNETSYGMHSITANDIFASTGPNGHHHQRQSQSISTPKVLPSLGGQWSSPFTPQPNELKPISPDRPSTARHVQSLQFSTADQQMQAAAELEEMTGYRTSGRTSWGRQPPQNVNQILQESLAQQYSPFPMQSTGFSDSSSIYVNNTPQAANRRSGGAFNNGVFSATNGTNSTAYAGASDFDRVTMLQSSIWNGSQPAAGWQNYTQTPPGGQGG